METVRFPPVSFSTVKNINTTARDANIALSTFNLKRNARVRPDLTGRTPRRYLSQIYMGGRGRWHVRTSTRYCPRRN
eukprot:3172970-Pyramimonas_sp.AAC.2